MIRKQVFGMHENASSIAQTATMYESNNVPTVAENTVRVRFTSEDGSVSTLLGESGQSLLELCREKGIQLGADYCDGALGCSNCHIYVRAEWERLLPAATQEEQNCIYTMIRTTAESRCACNIILNKDLDGITVAFPPTSYPEFDNFFGEPHTVSPKEAESGNFQVDILDEEEARVARRKREADLMSGGRSSDRTFEEGWFEDQDPFSRYKKEIKHAKTEDQFSKVSIDKK